MARKFEAIRLDLSQLAKQGKVKGFLNNIGNTGKLGGLLEDIRDAIAEYQVCMSLNCLVVQRFILGPDFIATRYL
jgi:hypothetical protein